MKIIIIIPIFLMLITSCAKSPTPTSASTETSTPINSGIEGQALIGPTCAGPVRVDSNCDDQPYQATLTVFSPKGERIVQVQTDEDGRFKIPLAPGEYILHPESEKITFAGEQTVIVKAGAFTQVIVNYDSGIR
ncbi:MAG TPA: hypothetical protein VJ987_08115 [Anaerolineales bacterium]|nr:hypothetical protein [Anaerolineales bacterium]